MIFRPLLMTTALLLALPAAAETYRIDPGHTQVRFGYNHLGFSNIVGIFGRVEGEIVFDPENPARASVMARIPIDGVVTGEPRLDAHLKNEDFFDIAQFPFATFQSTVIEPIGDGRLRVTGDLVIRDATQPVTLEVTMNKLGEHPMRKVPMIGFDARTTLIRSQWGLGRAAPAVSDEVSIEITVEALQKTD